MGSILPLPPPFSYLLIWVESKPSIRQQLGHNKGPCLHAGRLFRQAVRDGHLDRAPSWDQPGVEANVASNPHCILQVPFHLQQQSEQLCQLPLPLPY